MASGLHRGRSARPACPRRRGEPLDSCALADNQGPDQLGKLQEPGLGRAAVSPPVLGMEVGVRYSINRKARGWVVFADVPAPENAGPPRVVIRGDDDNRMPAVFLNAGKERSGFLLCRIDLGSDHTKIYARS